MKRTDLAYAGGILDGEGSINLVHSSPRNRHLTGEMYAQVGLTNTDERLIRWFQVEFGGSIAVERPGRNPLSKKTLWRWVLSRRQASEFLKLIVPYLWLKRPQAELAIRFQARKRVGAPKKTEGQLAVEAAEHMLMSQMNVGVAEA